MADNKLLELIDVLNKQLKKDHVTDADIEELDRIIGCLNGSEIAMEVAEVAKIAMRSEREARAALRWQMKVTQQMI
ncbi:hypothetical protein [Wolbachia endosymbiont (group E) of Neria commutata]|uniref:hypothetical protein n=1 Tax=Wolbachia endosymbiont (group E) of Neria commutata TaxID=3066149 RepID=UPI0031329D54